jgi:4Fe-4S single cluster domain
MARAFYPVESYSTTQQGYRLLPFRFLKLDAGNELLVNEVGEFVISPPGTAQSLVRKQLARGSDLYSTLKAKQFLTEDSSSPLLDVLATKYRTKYAFIDGFTKLHIFVVTLRCDHSCHYCQVSRQTMDKSKYDMSFQTAEKSVELMMKSPARHVTLELQGGEPLLAFDVIRHIVALAKKRAQQLGKGLDIVMTCCCTCAMKTSKYPLHWTVRPSSTTSTDLARVTTATSLRFEISSEHVRYSEPAGSPR